MVAHQASGDLLEGPVLVDPVAVTEPGAEEDAGNRSGGGGEDEKAHLPDPTR